jgi:hypothetical protein
MQPIVDLSKPCGENDTDGNFGLYAARLLELECDEVLVLNAAQEAEFASEIQ